MSELTRGDDDIRNLYRMHVPEVAAGVVEIMSVAREPGRFVMVAARSHDPSINPVSACCGERAEHMKSVMSALGGGGICVITWSKSVHELIAHTLHSRRRGPSRPPRVTLDEVAHQAHVQVELETMEDMTSQDGLLLKRACRLVGWDIKLSSCDKSSSR
jgi:N utilization substance protein A